MNRIYRTPGRNGGFSLIEVMIAVVVLATGLLALAALQASLARSSSDAKVRSRVAALLTARMDELRAKAYDSAATLADDGCTVDLGAEDWVPTGFCGDAGIGAITAGQSVVTYSSAVDAASFTAGRLPANGEPQFKRVTLRATWTDASNASHSLSMASEMSALALSGSILPPPPGSGTPTGAPIVRTTNPAGPGVIPIAIGGGDATAASNPRPVIIGKNNNQSTVGTKFDVVTYSGMSGEAVIQRRIETTAIKCDCKYGAGGTNLPEIYRTAQWPAVWTGDRYTVYKPDTAIAAPGTAPASGPEPGAVAAQSPLCQECCRDHHDTLTAGVAKFDPMRVIVAGEAHEHYFSDNGNLLNKVNNTSSAIYEESCRLVRVDGFWRTAADLYSRQMGLLATETVDNKPAKTGVPASGAVIAYQTFVKDYLAQYTGAVATAPAGADAMFNETDRGLNDPVLISIARPNPKDERYLHGRGLYVDHLEKAARDKITAVRLKCPTADKTECMLPYLPFTTINVTELAFWASEKEDLSDGEGVITVSTGGSLIFDPLLPTRGRTNAVGSATNADEAFSMVEMGSSNSGVAIHSGIDLGDEVALTDRQKFVVSATGDGVGDKFSVILSGGDLVQISDTNTANDPSVAWATIAPLDSGNCNATVKLNNPGKDSNPNNYVCNTSAALGIAGSVTVSNYFREYESAPKTLTATCTSSGGPVSVTGTIAHPQFDNFQVDTAKVGTVAATTMATNSDGKKTESTTATFTSIPKDSIVTLTFVKQATIEATVTSCTASRQNTNQPWVFDSVVWNRSWVP